MEYLASKFFIHRDLAARSVLPSFPGPSSLYAPSVPYTLTTGITMVTVMMVGVTMVTVTMAGVTMVTVTMAGATVVRVMMQYFITAIGMYWLGKIRM